MSSALAHVTVLCYHLAMMKPMATKWRLKETLERCEMNPNQLSKLTQGRLSRTSIYALTATDSPKHVQLETLDAIMTALHSQGHNVTFNDFFEYQQDMTPLFEVTA